ncbi:MAG: NADP-dependent oxidoreductase [Renibacterium salmoninarum]|nr:NADP-dependent oxidoreductase [Renibacterium salmoninarum]
MRAVTVSEFGGPEKVEITEHPTPTPGSGQVRIKVRAAALNPVDVAMRTGVFGGNGQPIGLGFDVAGTVDAVGSNAGFSVGDRVFGLATGHNKKLGTHADYVVLDAQAVAHSPADLSDLEAGSLPLNTLTAMQALDYLGLKTGQRLLITGAAGGVGSHATELAHYRGIVVTGLDRSSTEDFVRARGAQEFCSTVSEIPSKSFDGVFDTAVLGSQVLDTIHDAGSYVGLWPGQEPSAVREIAVKAMGVRADHNQLAEIAQLADRGVLLPRVAKTFALADAASAHACLAEGRLPGRILLVP